MTSIDHIDLNLLRVFQTIVEERSLTKAGERLALSQPAVSYSLGRLRTLFDDTLFIRTRASMQPTPVALELAEIVGRALDTVRQALRYAERFDPATSTRTSVCHFPMRVKWRICRRYARPCRRPRRA
ncbi:LysR-type transcriptional regulator NahR [Candidatus Burkholderia humilis]|nr:LysR-type transcriptional regulator NahR [Candidatus Burkholderia humilis]